MLRLKIDSEIEKRTTKWGVGPATCKNMFPLKVPIYRGFGKSYIHIKALLFCFVYDLVFQQRKSRQGNEVLSQTSKLGYFHQYFSQCGTDFVVRSAIMILRNIMVNKRTLLVAVFQLAVFVSYKVKWALVRGVRDI